MYKFPFFLLRDSVSCITIRVLQTLIFYTHVVVWSGVGFFVSFVFYFVLFGICFRYLKKEILCSRAFS